MAGGVGAGLGLILLMEMLNRSIRRPVDLSAKLGIQPFATVPYIRTPGEVRRKRAAIIAALALIAVAIPVGLFLVHTYYLPLDLILGRASRQHVRRSAARVTARRPPEPAGSRERETRWNASRPPSRKPRNSGARSRRRLPRPRGGAAPRPPADRPGASSPPSSPIRG